jgi:predicted AlkP superfamily pyrophosphatase or phosphodiesterase
MKKMMVLLVMCFITNLYGQAPNQKLDPSKPLHNTIYISIDGLSRETFYGLLNKQKLPNIQKIIGTGNYRNMDIEGYDPEYWATYSVLLSGEVSSINRTIFDRLNEAVPDLALGYVLSSPKLGEITVSLNMLSTANVDYGYPEVDRSRLDVVRDVSAILGENEGPFFLFFNFTDMAVIGHRYREGAQRYSDMLVRVDRSLGKIVRILKQKKQFENTLFLLTTTYGFEPSSQEPSPKIWIASSEKIRFKGTQSDFVPTILNSYGIDPKTDTPNLKGHLLFN